MTKRLGQHFLKSDAKIKKIIGALELKSNDTIIEIGAGHGELTKAVIKKFSNLVVRNFNIIAIEKDEKLYEELVSGDWKAGESPRLINGDALKLLPKTIAQLPNYSITNYKIIGNIPYYITGRLLRVLGELKTKPELIVLTIQKEVAERLTAKPPRTNILAASVQIWAKPEIIDHISKKDFKPQPKVDSAVIKLTPQNNYSITQLPNYYRLLKILFKQPRKTILNNLADGLIVKKEGLEKKIKAAGINPIARPQNLKIEEIKNLQLVLATLIKN